MSGQLSQLLNNFKYRINYNIKRYFIEYFKIYSN